MKKIFAAAFIVMASLGCERAQYDLTEDALFVVNGGSHSVSVIDLADYQTIDVLALGEDARFPHHIYMSPDKEMFAVSITDTDLSGGHSHGSDPAKNYMVLVFQCRTGKLVKQIELEGMAHNAVFSPDGNELWIGESGDASSHVRIYDTRRFRLQESVEVGSGLSEVTFSADGSRAYAVNTTDNSVSIINPISKEVVATLGVGSIPVGAWPASNGRMYLDSEGSFSVTEIDVAGDSIISVIPVGSKPGYAAYNAVRGELWVSDATNGKVLIFEKPSGTWMKTGEILTGADAHAILFSMDGKIAFVSNQGAGNVSVLDVELRVKIRDIEVESMPNGLSLLQ